MALRARCSGLILGLQRSSVINSSSFRLKYRQQNASHQIDQIGAHCHIHGHGYAFFPDHQAQQFQLLHDDLPCIRQQQMAEGYRGRDLHPRVAKVTKLEKEELPC
jgi:hypothetical protein